MFKIILIVIVGLLVIVLAYLGWVFLNALQATEETVTSEVTVQNGLISIIATLHGAKRDYAVTEIGFPRQIGESLRVSPPSGFVERPLTLEDTGDPEDPAFKESIDDLNTKTIRWRGQMPFKTDVPVSIHIPFVHQSAGRVRLTFLYEGKFGIGGKTTSFYVDIDFDET